MYIYSHIHIYIYIHTQAHTFYIQQNPHFVGLWALAGVRGWPKMFRHGNSAREKSAGHAQATQVLRICRESEGETSGGFATDRTRRVLGWCHQPHGCMQKPR